MIKNLVLGSGGHNLIRMAGCLQTLLKVKYINHEEIENIYATSAGAILGVYICLNLNWETLIEYITNKPWTKKYETKPSTLFSAFDEKGIFGNDFVKDLLEVQFKMKGLKSTITLKEFYEYSKINLNMYSFNLNKFESECLNYKTYPDLSLLDAVYMSSSFPFIFKPLYIHDSYYIDGGLDLDFPYDKCIKDDKNEEETLSIKIMHDNKEKNLPLKEGANILEMAIYMFRKLIHENRKRNEQCMPKKYIEIKGEPFSLNSINKMFDKENRRKWINDGREIAHNYLNQRTDLTNSFKLSSVGCASNS
jgi:predicted acylesterase/phospholipase RssA